MPQEKGLELGKGREEDCVNKDACCRVRGTFFVELFFTAASAKLLLGSTIVTALRSDNLATFVWARAEFS